MKAAFKSAYTFGLDPDQFWKLTPFALSLIADAYNQKTKDDMQIQRWNIWHMAALTRIKKMPNLKQFIQPLEKSAKVGIDENGIKTRLRQYQDGQSSKSQR